jgi:hypothetical protein
MIPLLCVPALVSGQTVPSKAWITTIPDAGVLGAAIGPDGRIYLAGLSNSLTFPITSNALQSSIIDRAVSVPGFFTILDSSGQNVLYSTYLNGIIPERSNISCGAAIVLQ